VKRHSKRLDDIGLCATVECLDQLFDRGSEALPCREAVSFTMLRILLFGEQSERVKMLVELLIVLTADSWVDIYIVFELVIVLTADSRVDIYIVF